LLLRVERRGEHLDSPLLCRTTSGILTKDKRLRLASKGDSGCEWHCSFTGLLECQPTRRNTRLMFEAFMIARKLQTPGLVGRGACVRKVGTPAKLQLGAFDFTLCSLKARPKRLI